MITRCILRWGLIGGLALGGVTLLVGPERVAAGFSHLRSKAQTLVDAQISEPIALRRQLAAMADQYPERIAEVEREVAAVVAQIKSHEYDIDVAQRVVALTTDQLSQLKTLITRAETEAQATARPVALRFEGVRFNVDQAYSEARRINNVRGAFQERLTHDEQQLKFLQEQHVRLRAILDQLKTEADEFEFQLAQLDRQIESIERNDRLIKLTEQQQATLDNYEKFGKVGNLKQLEGKLAQLRAVQQAQMERLEKRGMYRDYENRVRFGVENRNAQDVDPFDCLDEINPGDAEKNTAPAHRSMVWNKPVIIE